ncbi:hypothetical protein ACFGVR_19060 [Mucilaginibacter sp. AW1-3]
MKKQVPLSLIYCVLCLFLCSTILSSCEKIPGHATGVAAKTTGGTGSTGGTGGTGGSGGSGSNDGTGVGNTSWGGNGVAAGGGSGPVAVGPANTVIFRINNDTTYTWPAKFFNTSYNTLGAPFNSTQVTFGAKASIGYNDFEIDYQSLTPGSFSHINLTINLSLSMGNDQKTYLTSSHNDKVVVISQTANTVTGTFSGYLQDASGIGAHSSDSVRVVGSFNISQ